MSEEFKVGDRVRLRNLSTTRLYAGKRGTVIEVSRNLFGKNVLLSYRVRLNHLAAGYVTFSPHELEPAPEGDRP